MWNIASKLKQSIKDRFSTFHQKQTDKPNLENKDEELIQTIGEKRIIDTINNSDIKEAKKIYNTNILPLLDKKILVLLKKAEKAGSNFYKEWKL